MTKRAWVLLLAALFFLQIADGFLTWHTLDAGLATEGNVVADKLIRTLGLVPGLIILKTIAVALVFAIFIIFDSIHKKDPNSRILHLLKVAIILCIAITGYDVVNWVMVILKQAAS